MDRSSLLREEVALFFLNQAIEEGHDDTWLENVLRNFRYYFCPENYRGKNIEEVVAQATSAKLINDFLRDCPDLHYDDRRVERWISQKLHAYAAEDRAVIECVKVALTLEAIERDLEQFEDGDILGSGRKPGKSFIIRYIERACGIRVEVSTYHQMDFEVIIFPDDQKYRLKVPGEIAGLMRILGVPSTRDFPFQAHPKMRATRFDVRVALIEVR